MKMSPNLFLCITLSISILILISSPTAHAKSSTIVIGGGKGCPSGGQTLVKTSRKGNTIIVKGGAKKKKCKQRPKYIPVPVHIPVHVKETKSEEHHGWESKQRVHVQPPPPDWHSSGIQSRKDSDWKHYGHHGASDYNSNDYSTYW